MVLLMALVGGILYRWRGHASKYKRFFPRPVNQIAFALPYALACVNISWWAAGVVLVATTLAVLSGHGQYMSLATVIKFIKPERIDPLVKIFFGEDPREKHE